jgi:hypothetical protein
MEAARTSETSVNFYQNTRRNIPEDSMNLHEPVLCTLGLRQAKYIRSEIKRTIAVAITKYKVNCINGLRMSVIKYLTFESSNVDTFMAWKWADSLRYMMKSQFTCLLLSVSDYECITFHTVFLYNVCSRNYLWSTKLSTRCGGAVAVITRGAVNAMLIWRYSAGRARDEQSSTLSTPINHC